MITIGKPYICEDGEYAYLKAPIRITEDTSKAYMALQDTFKHVHWRLYENYPPEEWQSDDCGLWFAVPKEYKPYLCDNRGDAFVVALIWYAMVTGSDIKSEVSVSSQLAFSIQHLLIPALMKEEKGYSRRINLICETTTDTYPNNVGVGTGMSCGVDSLYTLKKYRDTGIPEPYRLTHLAYFNMGAIFHPDRASKKVYSMKEFYETTDRMSEEKCQNAREVAKMSNLPLLYIKSNMDSDYYRGAYGDTGVYRNCACVLAMQKLFGKYYCSSAGWPEYFNLNLDQGSEHYESLLCNAFTTENTQFILSDYASRLEKTVALADDPIAQRYLDVCFRFNSCGECSKCYRTLLTLDIIGKVDLFKNVFDVRKFMQERDKAYAWLLKTKDGKMSDDNVVFAVDIYNYAMAQGIEIPQSAYELYFKKNSKQKKNFVSFCRSIMKMIIH